MDYAVAFGVRGGSDDLNRFRRFECVPGQPVVAADKIRGRLEIKIVIGSEDGLLKWTEQLHTSMVKLKISHELEIVGGVGHDFGAPDTGIYEHQLRGLRYAVVLASKKNPR